MTWASDDLASVLVAPDREWSGYGQGILRSFNAETFANTVEYRGALLHDLPVLPGLDALGWVAGDIVLLMKWKPAGGRGVASYWIAGNPVIPGTGTGEKKVAVLRSNVASQIAREVIAAGIKPVAAAGAVTADHTNYQDKTDGPVVEDVEIGPAGLALVGVGCNMAISAIPSDGPRTGYMAYRVSGATTVVASDADAYQLGFGDGDTGNISSMQLRTMAWSVQSGLSEGLHTFTAQYRTGAAYPTPVPFDNRIMIVMGF